MRNDGVTICDLRQKPDFTATVAERIWQAWWRENGVTLAEVDARVRESLHSQGIPLCFVAHEDERFIGTVSLIENDMEERPQYAPWIAALWVDEDGRGKGVGSKLTATAAEAAFNLGMSCVYLCATEDNSGFYQRMGWKIVETGVDDLNIFRLDHQAQSISP